MKMLTDILFIISQVLELLVLAIFIKYTLKYFAQYQEKVDPYTKSTLILLTLSLCAQMLRIPLTILKMIYETETDKDSSFSRWYLESQDTRLTLSSIIVFLHGNMQKSAILINVLRWQILVINLQARNVARLTRMAKILLGVAIIVMLISSYVLL